MAASYCEGPGSHSEGPGSEAASASGHGISPQEASSAGAVPWHPGCLLTFLAPMASPYRGLCPPPPTPRATTGPGEHFPAVYRCLHGSHMQLAVPSFPPRGPRALLCPETPPAIEAREGHHMRQDRLGSKQGKGALGGHLCGLGRERGKAGSNGEEQQTRTGRAGRQGHVRCLVIRKTESRPAT